ncbi:MAG: GreA/GreB family elongation factor [Chitinophagaceae bacterium]|nr:GreA/GreB family elongation factor [Chitinophagaceae bacterium]MCW5905102.1 GreA/GreB family elongation factor [Chitinophagaceae bacterium]
MELTEKLLTELQRRLKIGNRRGVHLNAIPANSRYKFDLNRLSHIDKNLPDNFVKALLSELPLKFRISWKDNVPDLNSLFEEDQSQLVRITKAFENLINQTEAIESEKGINTFGFGFPILARRDRADNKLTVAPILIWSLRIKRTKEFNTWEILRNEEDPIYINEVLINHLQSDANVEIEQIPSDMLDDGLINKNELIEICSKLIRTVNTTTPDDLEETFKKKLDKITSIGDKAHYDKLPLNSSNSFIDFGGLFSIFEVQKQNIINDYGNLMELEGINIDLEDLEGHSFQPISSVETDPSQQSILHSLEATRNILIQGPPGTGKSQTLTAVLINALENNKKTIVVCEKRTALEVLHNALIEKGLNYHCVLVRDIVKDRKTVVDSVRDRVDNSEYKRYRYSYSKESLDNLIQKAKDLITNINNKHQKLDKKLIGNKSWSDVVGNLLTEIKGNTDDSNLNIEKTLFNYSTQELNTLLDLVQKGQILYTEFLPIESTSFINSLKLVGDNPYLIEQSINEDFDVYSKQLEQIKILLEANRSEFISLRKSELKNQITSIGNCIENTIAKENELSALVSNAKDDFSNFRNIEFAQQLESISQILSQIDTIFSNNQNNPDLTNSDKVNGLGYKFLSVFSKSKKQTIADHIELQSNSAKLEECLKISKDFATLNFSGSLEAKKNSLPTLKTEITSIKNSFSDKIENEFALFNLNSVLDTNYNGKHFHAIQSVINNSDNSEKFRTKLQSIQTTFKSYLSEIDSSFQALSKELAESKDIKLNHTFDKPFPENKEAVSELKAKIELIKTDFDSKIQNEFQQISLLKANPNEIEIKSLPILQEKVNALADKIKGDSWTVEKVKFTEFYKFISDIETLIRNKNEYFKAEKDLFTIEFKWFQFYNGLSEINKTIVNELKPKSNWRKSFLVFYLNSMLVNSANLDLPTNDDEHKELDKTLNGVEKEQLNFIKEFWFSKQIDATREFEQKNVTLSVENLYNKRSSNRFKRLSLRQIVQYDANLFTNFFPIILTSPDVASNLFKGMNGYFDIVMFDEASQLRLEDNLPAILKGKQIIIAGDEHQMPPSNYFSKVFDGAVEDEEDLEEENEIVVDKDNILLSCESLLDFGSELNFQRKHLDFHYRSRHPFLIDFSNYAFYNQRLKPLPNNFDYVPIKYVQVNGTFSEHTNEAEAEMVLSIIDKNINRLPNGEYPTVGIATFNIAQRNLIKSKILERQKFSKFEEFNAKIQELEEKGMFIKNLENIQGDERDVIILSTTYGIGKDRKFAQRFGPINHSKGYKLLNVIITRAKFKVYCCSSIPEQVFMNYKEYLTTEGSNNKRAVLYAYLAYCKAVSESNNDLRLSVLTTLAENTTKSAGFDSFKGGDLESPFEEEVYQSLADHLGTEKLIPQLQFAGFRIDIVYDPKVVGVPKVAIECDGAKYHSSREAYLYDRHRQKILENHGFVFHRIWSTNWWRNSSRETTKLVDYIKQIESTTNPNYKDHSHTAFAFTDDIVIIEDYVSQTSFIDIEKDNETIQAIEKVAPAHTKIFTDEVKLNSKVQVKYVNNGKDISIHIVSTENNKNDKSDGIQKVYYKSPLAHSLLGQTVGDIVKIGNLDNFVEILKITN